MSERGRGREAVAVSSHLAENQPSNEIEIRPDPPPLLSPSPPLVRFIFPAKVAITVVDFRLLWDFYDRSVVGFQFGFCEGAEGEKEGIHLGRPRTTEEVFFLATVVAPSPLPPPSLSAIWCADSFQISFPLLPRHRRRLTLPPLSRVPGRKGTSSYPSFPPSPNPPSSPLAIPDHFCGLMIGFQKGPSVRRVWMDGPGAGGRPRACVADLRRGATATTARYTLSMKISFRRVDRTNYFRSEFGAIGRPTIRRPVGRRGKL